MRTCKLPNVHGGEDEYQCYTQSEFPYWRLRKAAKGTRAKNKPSYLCNICTFDIESTTIEGEKPYAFMYHWQACIDGCVAYGRTWKEWEQFLKKLSDRLELSESRRLPIYVHNLGFEYQFMKAFLRRSFGDMKVFAPQPRKPLRVECAGFEFRCSWKLSNMSLERFAMNTKGVEHLKMAGDLDYRLLRTPDTKLTDTEFSYCIGDVVSLYESVLCLMREEGDDAETIPMTSTGYVRRDCRKSAARDKGYRQMFTKLKLTENVYRMLKSAARGGDTHASRMYSGHILESCDSYDVQSSYPAMMMLRRFPMTQFVPYGEIGSLAEFQEVLDTHACLFTVTLTDLRQKSYHMSPYISHDKCEMAAKPKLDNGRVYEAEGVRMTVTDVDWRLIERQYDWDEIYVDDMHIAEYGRLPKAILDVVMDYFRRKTELKAYLKRKDITKEERENAEYLYGKSKNRLNGIFGMCFTDPVHDIVYEKDDGRWKQERPKDIAAALAKYQKSRNSFLYYPWGIWVTAWARTHLADLIEAAGQERTAYCDTDSAKGPALLEEQIESLNLQIETQCESAGAFADDHTGARYYLGVYEKETRKKKYDRFVTLGAKKYAYTTKDRMTLKVPSGRMMFSRTHLHITISGVHKTKGAKEMGTIENFRPGFVFREAGGLELTYNESSIRTIDIEGCSIETASNIAMTDSTYRLGITPEYERLLGEYAFSIED